MTFHLRPLPGYGRSPTRPLPSLSHSLGIFWAPISRVTQFRRRVDGFSSRGWAPLLQRSSVFPGSPLRILRAIGWSRGSDWRPRTFSDSDKFDKSRSPRIEKFELPSLAKENMFVANLSIIISNHRESYREDHENYLYGRFNISSANLQ